MKSKLLLLLAVVCMASCASVKSARVHYQSLDVETFAKYIEQKDVVLVDVRTAEEYAAGHLPNVEIAGLPGNSLGNTILS